MVDPRNGETHSFSKNIDENIKMTKQKWQNI
jgi:hypothetical protein